MAFSLILFIFLLRFYRFCFLVVVLLLITASSCLSSCCSFVLVLELKVGSFTCFPRLPSSHWNVPRGRTDQATNLTGARVHFLLGRSGFQFRIRFGRVRLCDSIQKFPLSYLLWWKITLENTTPDTTRSDLVLFCSVCLLFCQFSSFSTILTGLQRSA